MPEEMKAGTGVDVMTPDELAVCRERTGGKTQAEREQIRREHHEQMQARAKAQELE